MSEKYRLIVDELTAKGVRFPAPQSVEIGPEVKAERISGDGVVIHTGCKITGESTWISSGVRLGEEGPVTVDSCQIGPNVNLRGGYFQKAVFLANASAGSGSHVREATILEEGASIAHTVGLKQTILFPFVTLGSLINFCDCFMAGGTDRKNHSEVGSAYIHFNFTPNQDKATASLLGDVPRGVMLTQTPIFLGGQGGLVGPCRLEYGTVIAAGTIQRKDELRPGRLIFGGGGRGGNIPYLPATYRGDKRIVENNLIYIANLIALGQWYDQVRALFISPEFAQPLLDGMQEKLALAVDERIRRIGELILKTAEPDADNKDESTPRSSKRNELASRWPEAEKLLATFRKHPGDAGKRENILKAVSKGIDRSGKDYLAVIKGLKPKDAQNGSAWLQGIVDEITTETRQTLFSE